MFFFNVSLNSFISHSNEFEINTNLLETNVINLSVVIGVLFYYGGSLFLRN